mmetsp:Transcript_27950/g.80191  ORF Transcript_27950/g.80191 Transcript_27950/m.80191 type:complete len:421 (-) Transcript_27950:136-1398(-)
MQGAPTAPSPTRARAGRMAAQAIRSSSQGQRRARRRARQDLQADDEGLRLRVHVLRKVPLLDLVWQAADGPVREVMPHRASWRVHLPAGVPGAHRNAEGHDGVHRRRDPLQAAHLDAPLALRLLERGAAPKLMHGLRADDHLELHRLREGQLEGRRHGFAVRALQLPRVNGPTHPVHLGGHAEGALEHRGPRHVGYPSDLHVRRLRARRQRRCAHRRRTGRIDLQHLRRGCRRRHGSRAGARGEGRGEGLGPTGEAVDGDSAHLLGLVAGAHGEHHGHGHHDHACAGCGKSADSATWHRRRGQLRRGGVGRLHRRRRQRRGGRRADGVQRIRVAPLFDPRPHARRLIPVAGRRPVEVGHRRGLIAPGEVAELGVRGAAGHSVRRLRGVFLLALLGRGVPAYAVVRLAPGSLQDVLPRAII